MTAFLWLAAYMLVGMGGSVLSIGLMTTAILALPMGQPLLLALFPVGAVALAATAVGADRLCSRALDAGA